MTKPDDEQLLNRRKACLSRLDRWAHILDEAVPIPGTRFRLGLDAVVGLLPGLGDLAALALSSGLIFEALWARAPKRVWLRMCANSGIDFLIGLIPILGDIFDITFQSNSRNAALFRRWLERETQPQPPARDSRWASLFGALGVSGGLVVAVIASVVVWRLVFA